MAIAKGKSIDPIGDIDHWKESLAVDYYNRLFCQLCRVHYESSISTPSPETVT